MKLRATILYAAALIAFALLAGAFGYLDEALSDERRWLGFALIIVGLLLVAHAGARLWSDWPKMKPEHNTDLAFCQIMLGVVILSAASLFGGRPENIAARLLAPTPRLEAPADRN